MHGIIRSNTALTVNKRSSEQECIGGSDNHEQSEITENSVSLTSLHSGHGLTDFNGFPVACSYRHRMGMRFVKSQHCRI